MSTILERFEAKFDPCPTTGCYLWTAAIDDKGYGRLYTGVNDNGNPKAEQAHRVAYRLFVGPIPAGMEVCHHCDTPACVNPSHLFVGTHNDNMADRDAKGRAIAGQSHKTHCPRGHAYSGDNLYTHKGSRKCKACNALRTANWRERNKQAA
ncbi:endonuclease [Ralstonia phage Claudette]|uniref:HNH nuclease domain-containing protein n=3 Tax=Gervaisevirus TaxID=2843385 RepID=A0A7G5B848_9CAUD|nr:endonuclease [Ralstonia phage Claudette]YP_010078703.1 endonuclease [Ralstonia phage Gervaise]QMV32471.1 hypothetical protein 20A_00021 [Ralstonia phage Alix]QMV33281.1 hypothetical protein 1Ca_00043 [Ralstonia phage Gervaise]QPD96379.1 hypothetical protein 20Ca_00062 [Ralstonia phage Claudette]